MFRAEDPLSDPVVPLIATAVAALLFGFRAGSAAALGVGIAIIALLAAAYLYAWLGARSATATRHVAPRAYEDQHLEVRFAIQNRGALPLVGLEVTDVFPADRVFKKSAVVFPALPAQAEVEATYRADCDAKRGIYAVGPIAVAAQDPLGLFRVERELGEMARILVYPHVFPIASLPDIAGGTRFDAGARYAGLAGAGIEFLGTREYRPGDPLRMIHWPSTARTGRLVVKEMEETAAADVAIFIDLSRLTLRGLGRVSTVEYAIRIAASVAAHVARGANRVRIYGRGSRPFDVPPGSGDTHVAAILETLAVARADGDVPLAALLREGASALGKGATAVVIFSSLEIDLREYAEALAFLRARGVSLVTVLIDARTFVKIFDEQVVVERTAPDAPAVIETLLGEGATVYTIRRGDDLPRRFDAPLDPGATHAR
jgi:uncharacterized protein (DUF58 family)